MIHTKNIIIRTTDNGQDYTGIRFGTDNNSDTEIIIPRYFMPEMNKPVENLSTEEKTKLKLLARAWTKYQKRLKTKNNGEQHGEGINYDFDVVFCLVRDFLESGLYLEFEKSEKLSNSGKIDFSRTMKKCRPLILDEGPLYLPYVTRTKKIADEDLVRNVQILVLNDIAKKVGWLIGFNIHIPQVGIKVGIDNALISKLKMVKNNSYNTRKITLINYLVQYLSMQNLVGTDDKIIFVSIVHKFWETMIADVVGNVERNMLDKIFYVRHRYINKRTGAVYKEARELNPLIPDSVYMTGTDITILDAKYYDKYSLPNNHDITKQFAYMRKAFGYYGPAYTYRNIFIMPTDDCNHYSNKEIVFDVDPIITRKDDLIPIEIMYLNVTEVVKCYVNSLNISTSII